MSTDGKLKSLMTGGKELLKKVQLHTDILHIMLGRATLHNYQNMYRSNPHLEYVSGIPNDHTQQLGLFARLGQWKTLSLFSHLWFPTLFIAIFAKAE